MPEWNIETKRLRLRVLEPADAPTLYRYRCDERVARYQGWRPRDLADAARFIRENREGDKSRPGSWLQLGICLDHGELIGDLGIHFLDPDQWEIGYSLAPEHQGRGYATEAISAILDRAFWHDRIHRITGSVDPANTASIRLLQRLGFRQEAHFIQSCRTKDGWADDLVFAMLESEWLGKPTASVRERNDFSES